MNDRMRMLVSVLAVLAAGIALGGWLDDTGKAYADEAFKRALVTFAVSRTLNGVISVAQGTEVAVEPGGVGVNFTVGQILDPINDLVERFSAVMLVASSSLGLQNVLLRITGWWGVTAFLLVAAAASLIGVWWRAGRESRWAGIAIRILLVGIFIRFAMPLLIIGSNVVFDTFLAAEQAEATAALEATSEEIERMSARESEEQRTDQSMMGRLGELLDDSLEAIDVRDDLAELKERVSNASEHIVNLIVIFLLQTVILPLAFVWLIAEGLKRVAGGVLRSKP